MTEIFRAVVNGQVVYGDSAALGNVPGRVSSKEVALAAQKAKEEEIAADREAAKAEVEAELEKLDEQQSDALSKLQAERAELGEQLSAARQASYEAQRRLNDAIGEANSFLRNVDLGQDLIDIGSIFVPGGVGVRIALVGVGIANDALRPGGLNPVGLDGANAFASGVDVASSAADARTAAELAARRIPSGAIRAPFAVGGQLAGGAGSFASAALSDPTRFSYVFDRASVEAFAEQLRNYDVSFLQDYVGQHTGWDKYQLQSALDDANIAMRGEEIAQEKYDAKNQEIDDLIRAQADYSRRVAVELRSAAFVRVQRKHGLPTE